MYNNTIKICLTDLHLSTTIVIVTNNGNVDHIVNLRKAVRNDWRSVVYCHFLLVGVSSNFLLNAELVDSALLRHCHHYSEA
jgi:hypothetical protein